MTRIRAHHENHAATTHDLAVLANSLHACSNLHRSLSSLNARSDAPRRPRRLGPPRPRPLFHSPKRRPPNETAAPIRPPFPWRELIGQGVEHYSIRRCRPAPQGAAPAFSSPIRIVSDSSFRVLALVGPLLRKRLALQRPGPNPDPFAGRPLRPLGLPQTKRRICPEDSAELRQHDLRRSTQKPHHVSPFGPPVSRIGPSSVKAMVCSKCALGFPSHVATVHVSANR